MRKDIQLSEVDAANAGRNDPSKQFNVNDWHADKGNNNVGGVPAVVSSLVGSVLRGILLGGTNPSAKHFPYFLKYCLKF